MKVSVVNSAGDSFCWDYATHTFYGNYASDKVCCIFAGFEVVLSAISTLVDLPVTIMQVTVSVAIMQLEVSAAHMQVTVSAANMWVAIFTVIMQMGVSVAIIQVVILQCIMHMTVSVVIIQVTLPFIAMTVSSNISYSFL